MFNNIHCTYLVSEWGGPGGGNEGGIQSSLFNADALPSEMQLRNECNLEMQLRNEF